MREPGVGGVARESPRRDLSRSLRADWLFPVMLPLRGTEGMGQPGGLGQRQGPGGRRESAVPGGLFRSRATPHSPVTGFVTSQQLQREGLAPRCSLPAPNSWVSQDESVRSLPTDQLWPHWFPRGCPSPALRVPRPHPLGTHTPLAKRRLQKPPPPAHSPSPELRRLRDM